MDLLILDVTAHPGVSADDLESAVAKEVERVVTQGVEAASDLPRANAVAENEYVLTLESSEGRADALSKFATYLGEPRLALEYADRLRAVTAEQMDRFAARYLRRQDQVTLLYVPDDTNSLGTT
jgi:predicted Zn-dependent peptidase